MISVWVKYLSFLSANPPGVNVIAATAANGKVYCKAHSAQLLKARAYEQKAAKQQKPRHGKRAH